RRRDRAGRARPGVPARRADRRGRLRAGQPPTGGQGGGAPGHGRLARRRGPGADGPRGRGRRPAADRPGPELERSRGGQRARDRLGVDGFGPGRDRGGFLDPRGSHRGDRLRHGDGLLRRGGGRRPTRGLARALKRPNTSAAGCPNAESRERTRRASIEGSPVGRGTRGTRIGHRQRERARGGGRTAHAPRVLPPGDPRAHRDQRRLRHLVLRCVHRPARRRIPEVVHAPRRPGGGSRGHDDRGAGHRPGDASDPGRVPPQPRPPVRLLHPGHDHGGPAPPSAIPPPAPRTGARVPRGQPLPLHRLPEHREVDPRRRRADVRREGLKGVEMAITEKFVGQALPGKEGASLLTGQGTFVDNLTLPGMLYLAVVRSPFAHARIVKVDVSKAREMPGVVGAWSGEELAGEWAGPLPMVWPITEDIETSEHWPITKDKARFQGDGVAVVVAESRGIADDAAEVVAVEYEQLTPVLDLEEGAKDGSPLVHDELGTNAVVHWSHGGGGDQGVFDTAPVQLRLRYEAPRITPSPIE